MKIKIEVQYFNGCPNSERVLEMTKEFVAETDYPVEFEEILVETQEAAERYKFRGSPTILINGIDVDGLDENPTPSLACRYYQNGLPTKESIGSVIEKLLKSET